MHLHRFLHFWFFPPVLYLDSRISMYCINLVNMDQLDKHKMKCFCEVIFFVIFVKTRLPYFKQVLISLMCLALRTVKTWVARQEWLESKYLLKDRNPLKVILQTQILISDFSNSSLRQSSMFKINNEIQIPLIYRHCKSTLLRLNTANSSCATQWAILPKKWLMMIPINSDLFYAWHQAESCE